MTCIRNARCAGPTASSWTWLGTCAFACWSYGCDGFADIGTLPPPTGSGAAQPPTGGPIVDAPPAFIDECAPGNAAGLEGERLAAARAGGPVSSDARILYPYDGTVFPAGLAAPLLMWAGPRAGAVYLEARLAGLRYEGCLRSGEYELVIPDTLWREASRRARPSGEPLELELTALDGESVSGPLHVSITLSADTISGVLYYSSYRSALTGPSNLPIVMRLPFGAAAEPLLAPLGGCAGCHAVSADGTALLASISGLGNWYTAPGAAVRDPLPRGSNLSGAEFAAVDPTGTFYLAPAHPSLLGPRTLGASPQLVATLFELANGAPILDTGIPGGAATPAFSPDGEWLAFNDTAEAGHTLVRMAFSADRRQAEDYLVISSDAEQFPAWPTFRPDSEQVIFALGASSTFSADGTLLSELIGPPGPSSDLHIAALDGSQSELLFRAMGFASEEDAMAGRSYLPFGQQDLHQNYYPSVLPTRAGAHDWVFFDSIRSYGTRGVVRGLWCAALDVGATSGDDPSHPPFYVPGQEEGAANLRPIAVRRDDQRE
jgi:hypothetical protein